jgi:uncharacterized protein (TIGR02452 family)
LSGEGLRQIALATVAIVEAGRYTHPEAGTVELIGVAQAVAGTRHHLPEEVLTAHGDANPLPMIEVTTESTLAAAARMGEDAATLVFASAKRPGGGFLGGAKAQEESIARSSALYRCQLAVPEFYAYHRKIGDPYYSDRVIYSPGVPVFRDDNGALLAKPYRTSFLSAAAPNLRNHPQRAAGAPEVLRRRASRVLQVAATHGHRSLVLGAWGCGAFRNEPAIVADAFARALASVNWFDHIVFAIRDRLPGAPAYRAFAGHFHR